MIPIEENLNIYFPLDLKPRDQQIEMLKADYDSLSAAIVDCDDMLSQFASYKYGVGRWSYKCHLKEQRI